MDASHVNRLARTERIGRAAAGLAIVEVGAGSLLHAFKVPLSGHALALNQAFFLARFVRVHPDLAGLRTAGGEISVVVALLKSLSPAGKRLTPMLAISAQGVFFSLGTTLFGPNFFGVALGTLALAVWTAIQPFALYYLLYGKELVEAASFYLTKLSALMGWELTNWFWAAGILAAVHAFCALAVAGAAWRLPNEKVAAYERKLLKWSRSQTPAAAPIRPGLYEVCRQVLKDLRRPTFVASIVMTAVFFAFADVPASRVVWGLLRPIAVGAIVFFLLRWIRPEWVATRVKSKSLVAALRYFH